MCSPSIESIHLRSPHENERLSFIWFNVFCILTNTHRSTLSQQHGQTLEYSEPISNWFFRVPLRWGNIQSDERFAMVSFWDALCRATVDQFQRTNILYKRMPCTQHSDDVPYMRCVYWHTFRQTSEKINQQITNGNINSSWRAVKRERESKITSIQTPTNEYNSGGGDSGGCDGGSSRHTCRVHTVNDSSLWIKY